MAMRWNVRRVSPSCDPGSLDFAYPHDSVAIAEWRPQVAVKCLAHKVLAVANTRIEGTWKAYISDVPGKNHDEEWKLVRSHGVTLQEDLAKAMFPGFAEIPYIR